MKNLDRDILRDTPQLKDLPFDTPDGYFDKLKLDLKAASSSDKVQTVTWKKAGPYIAAAAMFAMLIAAGAFFLSRDSHPDFTVEDYLVFSNSTSLYYGYDDYFADAEDIEAEDIVEYLIYTGATVESIESNE